MFVVVVAAAGYGKSTAARRWSPEALVLESRAPIPVPELLEHGRGLPVEVGPRQLALSPEQVDAVLAEHGVEHAGMHELTAGWPALVHLAAQAIGQEQTPGTALFDYIATEVLDALPPGAEQLVAVDLGPITAELAVALGNEHFALLTRLGLLTGGPRWYRPVPLVAQVARKRARTTAAQRKVLTALAVEWYVEHGRRLLAEGAAEHVLRFVRTVRDDALELLHADACQATGDTARALRIYAALADGRDRLPAELAWRYGAATYMWGDPHEAISVLRKGEPGNGPDGVMLLAWKAAAHWLAGEAEQCTATARQALESACDDQSTAAAHVAMALSAHLDGDPMALRAHYATALGLATSAGDLPMVLRIRINLAAALEQEGKLADALTMLGPAVELARRHNYLSSLALALANEGALHQQLGKLDDAVRSYEQAVEAYQQMHSLKAAYPLTGLGDVHRLRGRFTQARAAYSEALRAAIEDGNNRQGPVPALTGLARVTTDPERALELAERAVEHASGHWRAAALTARGWVCLGAGKDAMTDADEACEIAAKHRDRAGLAAALELRAAAANETKPLLEALAIWQEIGAVLDADRVAVALGKVSAQHRLHARLASRRLTAAGVQVVSAPPPVLIRALGGFEVLTHGNVVTPTDWQSRKSRELLRLLVARRGAPVHRDELADLLWGSSGAKIAHRLSVALSTLRGVLDPAKDMPVDHYVTSTPTHVALRNENLVVDVEDWLNLARYALRTKDFDALVAADHGYTGALFADDPYFAVALRDEAHAAYLHVVRTLVEHFRQEGDVDYVVCYLQHILTVEPCDEQSHWDLVTTLVDAGRHGEASRAHERYQEVMASLGVRARPLPRL